MCPRGGRPKTFYAGQGDYEGEAGFWVEDEDGAEGFCPLDDEEAFWQLEDHDAFVLKRFPRRTLKSGKGSKRREKVRASAEEAASNPSGNHNQATRLTCPKRPPPINPTGVGNP